MMFGKIGAVILLVSNMERSTKFHGDVLGLPVKTKSRDWTEFFKGETVLALHPAKKGKRGRDASALVGFMVDDLEAEVRRLKAKRVKFFKKLTNEPFGKHAVIEDPDGRLISLAEIKSKASEGFDLVGFFGTD